MTNEEITKLLDELRTSVDRSRFVEMLDESADIIEQLQRERDEARDRLAKMERERDQYRQSAEHYASAIEPQWRDGFRAGIEAAADKARIHMLGMSRERSDKMQKAIRALLPPQKAD